MCVQGSEDLKGQMPPRRGSIEVVGSRQGNFGQIREEMRIITPQLPQITMSNCMLFIKKCLLCQNQEVVLGATQALNLLGLSLPLINRQTDPEQAKRAQKHMLGVNKVNSGPCRPDDGKFEVVFSKYPQTRVLIGKFKSLTEKLTSRRPRQFLEPSIISPRENFAGFFYGYELRGLFSRVGTWWNS